MNELIKAIDKYLEKSGKNQAQFAEEIGFSDACVSRIRGGQRNPSVPLLKSLVRNCPKLKSAVKEYIFGPSLLKRRWNTFCKILNELYEHDYRRG